MLLHPWQHYTREVTGSWAAPTQIQWVIQDISKFLASLCSLSNIDSVQSGNHRLNPKERSVKLYYSYNQLDSPSFSLCMNPKPKFSKSVNTYPLYSQPCVLSFDFFVFSSTATVFYNFYFTFRWLKKYTDFFKQAFTWAMTWCTSFQLIYFSHKVRYSTHLGKKKKKIHLK